MPALRALIFGLSDIRDRVGASWARRSGLRLDNAIVSDDGVMTIVASAGGGGEANTASNVGSGRGIVLPKSGVNLPFRKLSNGTDVTIVPSVDELEINAAVPPAVSGSLAGLIKFAGVTDLSSNFTGNIADCSVQLDTLNGANNNHYPFPADLILGEITAYTEATLPSPAGGIGFFGEVRSVGATGSLSHLIAKFEYRQAGPLTGFAAITRPDGPTWLMSTGDHLYVGIELAGDTGSYDGPPEFPFPVTVTMKLLNP